MLRRHLFAGDLELDDIGRERHAHFRGHTRCEVASHSRRRERRGGVAATLQPIGDERRGRLGIVERESGVFGDEHDVRAMCAERLRFRGDAGRANEHRMHFTAGRVGDAARRRDRLQRDTAQLATTRLGKRQNVRHK
jgi:hypothetical protein